MSDGKIEDVKAKFREALPHFRLALEEAKKKAGPDGKVGLGVIAMTSDGGGHVTARFEAPEFFEDLALLIGAGPSTKEEVMDAQARRIVDMVGAKNIASTPITKVWKD